MRTLSSLQREIDSLPKGNLYAKVIKGRTYYYHQFVVGGRKRTVFVNPGQFDEVSLAILRRKKLERELALRQKAKEVTLCSSAREYTGDLMSLDEVVASFDHGQLTWIDEKKAPLCILRTRSLNAFLLSRSADQSRTHIRILKRALGIAGEDDALLPLYSYGASISDAYWFRPKYSKLKYKDIVFDSDAFSDLALCGERLLFPGKPRSTPELTTLGSYEKGWKRINGEWWLYKAESKRERFSELYASLIAPLLGVPSAVYEIDGDYIRSRNFAVGCHFEPMSALCGDDDRYETVFPALAPYGEEIRKQYLRLVFFDALVNNVDRHNENCGLLRDIGTGHVLSLAPNFDDNLSLIARDALLSAVPERDGFIKVFLSFALQSEEVRGIYQTMDFPLLDEKDFRDALANVPKDLWPEGAEHIPIALSKRLAHLLGKLHG